MGGSEKTIAGTRDQAHRTMGIGLGLWLAALVVLGGGIIWLGAPAMFDTASPDFIPVFDFFAAALAAFGSLWFGRGLLAVMRHGKYGASTLEANAAQIGQVYRGRIRTNRSLDVTGPYAIHLLCESKAVSHGLEDTPSSKHRVPIWEAKTKAPATTRSSVGIPFEFRIPADAPPNLHGSSLPGQAIFWTLTVSAPMAGLHYRAEFPIDVGTGGEIDGEPAGDGPKSLAAAFAGYARPESPGMRFLRLAATILGGLLLGAGAYSTADQWRHGQHGVSLTGKVTALNRPAMEVSLDEGGTAHLAYIRKSSTWAIGQRVQVTCLREADALRSCGMDTDGHRWIDGLGTLAVGAVLLLFGGWLWHRRRARP